MDEAFRPRSARSGGGHDGAAHHRRRRSTGSLAGDLGVAPGTVARAYRELEAGGVLSTGRRQGTVVASVPAAAPDALEAAAAEFAATARALGVDVEGAVAALRSAYRVE